jgi:hypothetical protein
MRCSIGLLAGVLSAVIATEGFGLNYSCEVSELKDQGNELLGTMTFDTQIEDVSYVSIDSYLFVACTGAIKVSSETFLTCGFVIDSTDDRLNSTHLRKKLTSSKDAQEVRTAVLLPESVGIFVHQFRRNARKFQVGCATN